MSNQPSTPTTPKKGRKQQQKMSIYIVTEDYNENIKIIAAFSTIKAANTLHANQTCWQNLITSLNQSAG